MPQFINTIDLLGDDNAFASIVSGTLEEYNDDVLASIRSYAFYNDGTLKSVNLPKLITLSSYALYNCKSLTSVDLSSATSIGGSAFYNSSNFNLLVLRSPVLCTLSATSAFNGTPFAAGKAGGTIYVPQALIESYQTATNWSTLYAAGTCNFVAIEGSEYE